LLAPVTGRLHLARNYVEKFVIIVKRGTDGVARKFEPEPEPI
jgi:hypothetical protein